VTIPQDPGQGQDDNDIDAEFARLTEGLDFDLPSEQPTSPDVPQATGAGESGAGDDEPLTVEDILADDDDPSVAVVATSVVSSKALAGAIRLGREARTDGVDIPVGTRVYDTERGAIAVGPLDEDAAHDLGAVVSTALQRHGVVLFWRKGEKMTATRYKEGERGEDVSPALVMGAMDEVVEQLLLGGTDLGDMGQGLDPTALSRTEALTWIASGRRKR
jgi:hypothetical protein